MNTQSKHGFNPNDVKAKDTEFSALITSDVEKQTDKIKVHTTSATDILNELLATIKPVDFLLLIFPKGEPPTNFKITNNHYLILVVEQLLKTAKLNNWGLAKKNDFIYVYSGQYWISIDKEEFKFFLGQVALKMGVEKFTGKIHRFRDDLYKQFISDAFLPTPKIDNEKVLINLLNGTFEVSPNRRKLRDFKRADFLTHQLPFVYDAQATAPKFQKFL